MSSGQIRASTRTASTMSLTCAYDCAFAVVGAIATRYGRPFPVNDENDLAGFGIDVNDDFMKLRCEGVVSSTGRPHPDSSRPPPDPRRDSRTLLGSRPRPDVEHGCADGCAPRSGEHE